MSRRGSREGSGKCRWLLLAYSRRHRRRFGVGMLYALERQRRQAAGEGRRELLRFWRRALLQALAFGLSDRFSEAMRGLGRPARSPGRNRRRRGEPMKYILTDLRHAARRLAKTPAFTAAAVLTVGLAIGATTAVFSLIHAVILNPLPYPEAERLVSLWHTAPGAEMDRIELSHGTYLHYREHNRLLEEMAVYRGPYPVSLTGDGEPARVRAVKATFSFFQMLSPRAALGRVIQQADDRSDSPATVVLSHRLWMERYGGDRGVVGRSIRLGGEPHEVVGVMPAGFAFPTEDTDLWTPLRLNPPKVILGMFSAYGIGKLRPGVSIEQARADLRGQVPSLEERFPGGAFKVIVEMGRLTPQVTPLKEAIVGDVEQRFWILFASVGFLFLVAAANVSNLVLARAQARRREMAVRQALGAGRLRVAGLFLAEGAIVALAGGVLGLSLVWLGMSVLPAFGIDNIPRISELKVDFSVVAFAVALSLGAALAFGLIPVLGSRRAAMDYALGSGRTAGLRSESRHSGNALVVAQIAAALLLVAGAGLMARSSWNLSRVDPGFEPEDALTFRLTLAPRDYQDKASRDRFLKRTLESLSGVPGAETVGAASCLPLSGCSSVNPLSREDMQLAEDEIPPAAQIREVSAGYFEAMGVPLVEGRFFQSSDFEGGAPVAVIGESLARRYWPNQSPLGKRILPSVPGDAAYDWSTVVGVVGDVRSASLSESPFEMAYFPLSGSYDLSFVVRSAGPPSALLEGVRERIRRIDPNLPIAQVRTLQDLVSRAKRLTNFTMLLLALSAGAALLIGIVGVYGVLAYAVSRRRGEIGVRMALGAGAGDIRWMILARGCLLAVLGVGLGLAGSLALLSQLESVLFGVHARDASTYALVCLVLFAAVLLASYLPARRASRQDPNRVLRQGTA